MASTTLQRHYLRIIRSWPSDYLRPVNVQDALRRRIAKRLLPASQQQKAQDNTTIASEPPLTNAKANTTTAEQNTANLIPTRVDEEGEIKQVNALYSLLANRYSSTYPTSERLLRPESKPTYYADLAAEMEAAPQRTWLQKKILRLTSLVRFS